MVQIIITGHGKFSTGIKSAVDLIMGVQPYLYAVDFEKGESEVDLKEKLLDLVDKKTEENKFLFLTDMMGGTPYKTAVTISQEITKTEVVAGTNLPLVMEIVMIQSNSVAKLKELAIKAGSENIRAYSDERRKKNNKRSNKGEGI